MAKMNEIFVGVKEVGYIETQISKLCEKYKNRYGVEYIQQRALFRNYCHDTINVFEDCFETSMLGMQRCVESGGQELSYTLGTQYIPSNESRKWAAWGISQ